MTRSRILTGIISAAFCLTLVSSVRADRDDRDQHGELLLLEKLIFAENHGLIAFDNNRAPGYLYAAHFENNNGKHLGFSVAATKGVRLAIVLPPQAATAAPTQNPEPTAMVLLGTGLAAIGAIARKLKRRRKSL